MPMGLYSIVGMAPGRLHQAFVIDPHIHNVSREPDPANPLWGKAMPVVTCEDYIGTIGDWWGPSNKGTGYLDRANGVGPATASLLIFKAMEEIAVASAFVIERKDGTFKLTIARWLKMDLL